MSLEGVERFTPSRLVLARERRGLTQRKLAEAVRVSDRMVKGYEAGEYKPTEETLRAIARELAFPAAFFGGPTIDRLTLEAASFRALSRAGAGLRNRAVAAGSLALELHRFLSDRFELPSPNVPDLRDVPPARAADTVRHLWGLGQKPVSNVLHLVEKHGVRVFSLSEDCDSIDAFSIWRDGVPFMFVNTRKTAERSVFDVAHELGHLVLHRHGSPQGQGAEKDADVFAANLLMPEPAMRAAAPRVPTIATLVAMKLTWRASVSALGFRLHELGTLSEWQYRHLNIELAKRGRANEPSPLPHEVSAVLSKALKALSEEGMSLREVARETKLPLSEVRSLTFGLHAVT